MKNRKNLIILCCALPGVNETNLWNTFYGANFEHYNVIFFSPYRYDGLDIPDKIHIDYGLQIFNSDKSSSGAGLEHFFAEIAEYDRIWECYSSRSMQVAYSWYHYWSLVLKAYDAVAVYIWNGYHIPEAALAKVADTLGVPKYYMERGPFANTYACDQSGINFASSFVRNYHEMSCDLDEKAVHNFAKIYFGGAVSNWEQPSLCSTRGDFFQRYGIPEDKVLIFFPSQVNKDSNAKLFSPSFGSVLEAYQSVASIINDFADSTFFLAKRHPKQENHEFFEQVPLKSGAWIDDAHIFDCIKYSNGIISINSSSAVEGAILGKPVLLLGQSILTPNDKVLSLRSIHDLRMKVEQLLSLSMARQTSLDSAYYRRLLFTYLYSPLPEYQNAGIGSVKGIPVPAPDSVAMRSYSLEECHLLTNFFSKISLQKLYNEFVFSQPVPIVVPTVSQLSDPEKGRLEDQVAELSRLLSERDQRLLELEQRTQGLLNSYSWKISSPFRWLYDRFCFWK